MLGCIHGRIKQLAKRAPTVFAHKLLEIYTHHSLLDTEKAADECVCTISSRLNVPGRVSRKRPSKLRWSWSYAPMRKDGSSLEEVSRFSFGCVAGAETTLACVTVWRGEAFVEQSLKHFTTIYLLSWGLHLWAGLTGRRLSCAAGLPKSAFAAPSPHRSTFKMYFLMSCMQCKK